MPEIEEREAARFSGYTWKQWQEFELIDPIGRWNRASGIAHYRLHHLIEQHIDDAMNSDIDRRSRKNGNV